MNKLPILLSGALAMQLLPAVSPAACVASGTISKVSLNSRGYANIGVRSDAPGSTYFNFTLKVLDTPRAALLNMATVAEASHVTVTVTGGATACGAVVSGQSAGGKVKSIIVSP